MGAAPAPTLAEQLADFISRVRPESLPAPVVAAARMALLDWLGAAVAGTTTAAGAKMLDYAGARPAGPATVVGAGTGRSPEVAALANGTLSHTLEVDDAHRASFMHPGAPVLPALLATAQANAVSGPALLAAIVVGYEVETRIGEAVGPAHYRFWHHTATCGTFGAAAAVANLLRLTPTQTVWALGQAGTMAAGLWEFRRDGVMTKALHPGRAASNGILAAELGRRGFTGPRTIFEGEQGFFAAMTEGARPEVVTADLAPEMDRYRIGEVTFKPHASCRHTHPAVDAGLALRSQQRFDPEAIEAIRVETYGAALQIAGDPAPAHPYAAKFSIAYCLASALARGSVGVADFAEAALADPAVRRLAALTRVDRTPEMEARYPQTWPARVTLTVTGGHEHTATVDIPRGAPERPLGRAALEAKFHDLLDSAGIGNWSEALIAWVEQLAQAPSFTFPLADWKRATVQEKA